MSKNKSHNETSHSGSNKGGLSVKRDADSGKYMDRKNDKIHFKGVRKEALDKLSSTLNKLAKYDKQ